MFKRSKNGFTLIELLVVIAIIGILASIILASLNSARVKSRDARRIADLKEIQLALELYFNSNSAYPTTLGALVTGGQIPVIPMDPLYSITGATCRTTAGYCYAYCPSTGPTYYHLGANLEEVTNPALKSAKKFNSTGATCVTGSTYTGGFDASGSTNTIYDIGS